MSLILRPHTATIGTVSKVQVTTGSDKHTKAHTVANGSTVLGQLDNLTASQAFEAWGIETEIGARWFCNTADATLTVGYRLTIGGVAYSVKAGPKLHTHGYGLDHAEYLLERVNG